MRNVNDSYQCTFRRVHRVHLRLKAALIMFDLFAACDVMNHQILLKRLRISFGIKKKELTLSKVVPRDKTFSGR